ncbi:cell division protein FtsL [Donghicola sp. C2-DW-16]|uniref:Cell division protein FtsL n=1 Tax=Donghicola mangrovi TaxID=2729614 RepID=A0A850QD50_9RHOB|nr:cell division protein FtsL [Donghicola mangrovi]NVO24868.1 cell division protein FtsL [Donghicola mangrovi]NVO29099.1 cell division protein FtsL [Donghicola mangrovi]
MRTLFGIITAVVVIALAYWAYGENYRTQDALSESRHVSNQIEAARSRLAVLRAEWAYLNRPDRLRDLAELNFTSLGLLNMTSDSFGEISDIAMPVPVNPLFANEPYEPPMLGGN